MNNVSDFPSKGWLDTLAKIMEKNRAQYESLGSTDCTMVIRCDDPRNGDLIEVKFRDYGVKSVRHLDSLADADSDHFTITTSRKVWSQMIANIVKNGHPDLEHTLNYLTFPDDPMIVDGPDQLQIDTFFRYNQTLQLFFNGAAEAAIA